MLKYSNIFGLKCYYTKTKTNHLLYRAVNYVKQDSGRKTCAHL